MTGLHTGDIVHGEYSVGAQPCEQPFINHCLRAKAVLLIGLKDEDCSPLENTGLSKISSCTKQHACMPVIATGVHHFIMCRFMVTISCFVEGQGIHISSKGNTAGAITALHNTNYASATNFFIYLETKRFE